MQPAYNIISLQAETHTQNLKTGLMIEHATSRVKAPTAETGDTLSKRLNAAKAAGRGGLKFDPPALRPYFLDLGGEGLQSGGVGGSTPPTPPGNSTTAYIL